MTSPTTFQYWLDLTVKGAIAAAVSFGGYTAKKFSDRLEAVELQDHVKNTRIAVVEENQRYQLNQLNRIESKLDRLIERGK